MGNWHNVLRSISMASCKWESAHLSSFILAYDADTHLNTAKLAKSPANTEQEAPSLPQTLVRIPTEHAPALQAQADAAEEE